MRSLEACEEFLAHALGLSLEPRAHVRPDGLEGVRSGPPITRRPGRGEMGGADLALLQAQNAACAISSPVAGLVCSGAW